MQMYLYFYFVNTPKKEKRRKLDYLRQRFILKSESSY